MNPILATLYSLIRVSDPARTIVEVGSTFQSYQQEMAIECARLTEMRVAYLRSGGILYLKGPTNHVGDYQRRKSGRKLSIDIKVTMASCRVSLRSGDHRLLGVSVPTSTGFLATAAE